MNCFSASHSIKLQRKNGTVSRSCCLSPTASGGKLFPQRLPIPTPRRNPSLLNTKSSSRNSWTGRGNRYAFLQSFRSSPFPTRLQDLPQEPRRRLSNSAHRLMWKPKSRYNCRRELLSALPRAFPLHATMPPSLLNTPQRATPSPLPATSIFYFAKFLLRASRITTPSFAPCRTTNPKTSHSNAPNPPHQTQIRRRPLQQRRRNRIRPNPKFHLPS